MTLKRVCDVGACCASVYCISRRAFFHPMARPGSCPGQLPDAPFRTKKAHLEINMRTIFSNHPLLMRVPRHQISDGATSPVYAVHRSPKLLQPPGPPGHIVGEGDRP